MKKFFVLLLLFNISYSYANLTIEVSQGIDKPSRIAIVPFASQTNINALKNVINSNMRFSGRFELVPSTDFLSEPVIGDRIFFSDWRLLNVDFLLIGQVDIDNNQFVVNYELYDVVNAINLFKKRVRGVQQRDLAHNISNHIYFQITGIEGVFDSKIVYVTETQKNNALSYQLKLSDQDGAREVVITQSNEPLMSPTFSPDARKVAYVSFESGSAAIYEQDLFSGKRKIISNFKGINGAPNYSPDGQKMALVLSKDGNPEIYIKHLKTNRLKRLTNHFAIDTEPNWTADGKSLIFTSDRTGAPQIYQKTLATGKLKRLTFEGRYNARARISQDGKFIVLVHGTGGGQFKIAVLNVETGELLQITDTNNDESPSIAPNGAMIIYSSKNNREHGLNVVSLDAGVKYRLPSKTPVREPAWSPITK